MRVQVPAKHHGVAGKALAGTDLAVVRLRSGALDVAAAALEPALSLPAAQRVSRADRPARRSPRRTRRAGLPRLAAGPRPG